MRFSNVRLAAVSHVLPERVVRSEELEDRLAPLYRRLGLHPGRIELMTGIRERRFFEPGTPPSRLAAAAGERALASSGVDRSRVGCVIHASVCRDFLEPATASLVHDALGLSSACLAFDLSNACLGFANAMVVAASMLEQRQIEAALVVAAEDGRSLVEATLARLLSEPAAGKRELKAAFASLTIGSGAAAAVLARADLAPRGSELAGATSLAATEHHVLCHGDHAAAFGGPLMETDSEGLLQEGNALAARTWERFLLELGWRAGEVERVVTHQVGVAHRRLLFETLGLDPGLDFPTVETLGNIGSVSLPLTLSLAIERGFVAAGQRVAMLGIGSGLQCQMLGLRA